MSHRLSPLLGGRVEVRAGVVVETLGEGPGLVCLHAPELGADRAEWAGLVGPVVAAGYRVSAADLPGWGQSEPLPELTAAALTAALAGLLTEPAVLVARGFAAAYAALLAVDRPDVVRGLVAICPRGLDPLPDPADPDPAVLADLLTPAALAAWLTAEVYADPTLAAARLTALEPRLRDPATARVALALAGGRLAVDIRREWLRVACPVLLIWGERCDDPPLDDVDRWLMPLRPDAPPLLIRGRPSGVWKPGVTYKSVAGCRQRPPEEAPARVAAALLAWLDATPAGGAS